MAEWFHVTSSLNRDSIRRHGLDWRLMKAACGIAGSAKPEQEGCFLSEGLHEAEFFVQMNNTGGPVDVWAVEGIDEDELLEMDGFYYLPSPIPPERLRLVRRDIEPVEKDEDEIESAPGWTGVELSSAPSESS